MRRSKQLRRRGLRYERDKEFLARFRMQVLERDNYTCQYPGCGKSWANSSAPIDAHHRRPRSRGGAHDPENGISLCRDHHRLVHDHAVENWRDFVD